VNYWIRLALNLYPSDLVSQVDRIMGMSHWCPAHVRKFKVTIVSILTSLVLKTNKYIFY
jgi:hypothetical protein